MTFNHMPDIKIDRPFIEQLRRSDGHYYLTEDGKIYPSITTVLKINTKDGIDFWRAKVGETEANRISKNSMAVGVKLHYLIENYLSNKAVPEFKLDDFEYDPVKLFSSVRPEIDKLNNIHALEKELYSDDLALAGTVDCIAELDGVLTIVDFKNARKPKQKSYIKNYFIQGCAYSKMWKERTGIEVNQVAIMVAVWDDKPQVFIANVDDWENELWDTLIKYEQMLIKQ